MQRQRVVPLLLLPPLPLLLLPFVDRMIRF